MTIRHLAATAFERELTEEEFTRLNALKMIAPCHGCTKLLEEDGMDDVVYHPVVPLHMSEETATAGVVAVITATKH